VLIRAGAWPSCPFWGAALELDHGKQTPDGRPTQFRYRHQLQRITHHVHHWRVHTAWWTDTEVLHDSWVVTTETGLLATLYKDLHIYR
jgi:hypothetical protein